MQGGQRNDQRVILSVNWCRQLAEGNPSLDLPGRGGGRGRAAGRSGFVAAFAKLVDDDGVLRRHPYNVASDRIPSPLDLGSDLRCEAGIRFLGAVARFASREFRLTSILLLERVAREASLKTEWRIQALESLASVMRHETDSLLRVEAIKSFEDEATASLCEIGRNVATWWSRQKSLARSKTVLLSDDVPLVLMCLREILRREGWSRVHISENPIETIRIAEKVNPGLIVTDLISLGMDGVSMAEVLRQRRGTRDTPILLHTGQSCSSIQAALRSGLFQGALQKPALPRELLATVDTVLAGVWPGPVVRCPGPLERWAAPAANAS
ncbi:MAG: response regulator [Verrucomicrobia bacterium]|nr:response regulator [Verrucomicrobiota bacterium]